MIIYLFHTMSYLVLARKIRPKRFQDLIGQDHISKTLKNAIKSDRVAHAFLFTGPRGTGKTSCARILTKAINCLSLVEGEPCGECENCIEINQGNSPDVIEIDAASNRGIENIRELRDSVKFSPAKCQYKTYIIDEVHMLTPESFNALLKTLEEPPAHVKFVLATTDHHKVPATVKSRCQRFDFSNIPLDLMTNYLKVVAENESLSISDSALTMIAKSSTGGMRDALTALDMLISFSGDAIEDDKVFELLGLIDIREIDQLLKEIIEKDVSAVIERFHRFVANGHSITQFVTDLMRTIKDMSLIATIPEDRLQWLGLLPDQVKLYKDLSTRVTVTTLQQLFEIAVEIESQVKKSNQAKICAEMGLIRMCSIESLEGVAEIISVLRGTSQKKKPIVN